MTSKQVLIPKRVVLHCGHCLEVVRSLPDNSIDACVTDPPYALVSITKRFGKTSKDDNNKTGDRTRKRADGYARLAGGFMGKKWDTGKTAFAVKFWREIYRVLKPGGHVVAFGGTRTYHRLACAIEDAGFEIRDQIAWLYGSGMPKSRDMPKAIDREAGAVRKVVSSRRAHDIRGGDFMERAVGKNKKAHIINITVSKTDEAKLWEGFGTGLKPSLEPICLARKPISEKTVATNVLKWGTGAINVDGCRIGYTSVYDEKHQADIMKGSGRNFFNTSVSKSSKTLKGRWPANLITDGSPEVLAGFPQTKSSQTTLTSKPGTVYGGGKGLPSHTGTYGAKESGSATRFFYTAKADKRDRAFSLHPCLLANELVQTDKGFKPIKQITVGERVLSDDGSFREVTAQFSSPCDDWVYKIQTKGYSLTTTATGNHPFLILRSIRHPSGPIIGGISAGKIGWVPAEEIREKDFILTPVVKPSLQKSYLDQDTEWWFILGLWMAEGSVLQNSRKTKPTRFPVFTLSEKEMHLVQRMRKKFISVSVYPRPAHHAMNVVIFETGLVDTYIKLCGRGAKNKFISSTILQAGEVQRKAFLDGYLEGDGCVIRGTHRVKTVSLGIASTIPLLVESLGGRCSVFKYDYTDRVGFIDGRRIKHGIFYAISLSQETGGELFIRPKGRIHKTRFVKFKGRFYSLKCVKSVKRRRYKGKVWNLSVRGRHTFQTAVGMSHNTVKPVGLMRYLVKLVTPPNGIILDPFAGTGTTGEAAYLEGFNARLIEREVDYQKDIVRRMMTIPKRGENSIRERGLKPNNHVRTHKLFRK